MAKKEKMNFLPLIYGIFGIYFLNYGIKFFSVPEYIKLFDVWIITFGGILFFVAMYRMIVYSRKRIIKKAIRASK